MAMPGKTTRMSVIDPHGVRINWRWDQYPIIGGMESIPKYRQMIRKAFRSCRGLFRHWDCLEKAKRCAEVFPKEGRIAIGEFYVKSREGNGRYGFEYHPPTEFHAWVEYKESIIDLAAPGVILMGKVTTDHLGPILVGNEPFIFAGENPKNYGLFYRVHNYIT